MTITQISAWIMLVFCGLWAGGILIFAVERTNLWRRMPIDQYAIDFRRSLFRVDPMMPILGVIAGAATTIFAMHRSGAARDLAWTGLGFIVLVVMASITIAEPINSKFRRLPEGQTPQRAEHYRTLWRRFHALRNLAALAALACLAAAAVV
jgi:anthrone oxygenase-like protein